MTLCVVAGLQCAGKTNFIRVAKDQGCAVLEWSEVIYCDLGHPTDEDRTQWFKNVGQRVKEKGPSYYPRMIFQKLMNELSKIHVVSGARNPNELKELLGMYSHTAVVWIESDAIERNRRVQTRGRHDASNSYMDFIRHDNEELSGGLAEIAAKYVTDHIVNNDSFEIFERKIICLLDDLKKRSIRDARI